MTDQSDQEMEKNRFPYQDYKTESGPGGPFSLATEYSVRKEGETLFSFGIDKDGDVTLKIPRPNAGGKGFLFLARKYFDTLGEKVNVFDDKESIFVDSSDSDTLLMLIPPGPEIDLSKAIEQFLQNEARPENIAQIRNLAQSFKKDLEQSGGITAVIKSYRIDNPDMPDALEPLSDLLLAAKGVPPEVTKRTISSITRQRDIQKRRA